jgi:phage host-nuclease inhibitor protein Gam
VSTPFINDEEAVAKLREMARVTEPYSPEFNALCKAIGVLQKRIEDRKAVPA